MKTSVTLFTAAAVAAASGLVGDFGARPAAAAPVPATATLDYRCKFPLIGFKDIRTKITATIDDEIAADPEGVGDPLGIADIRAETVIGADITEALNLMNAATLEGSGRARIKVRMPGNTPLFRLPVTLEKTRVPEAGPFMIVANGTAPDIVAAQEGWAQIAMLDLLELSVKPRDGGGNETALRTMNVQCYQKPGQQNVLHQFYVKGASVKPTKPAPQNETDLDPGPAPKSKSYPEHVHSVTLRYQCTFPLIGTRPVSVNARLNYPESVPVGYDTPKIVINSVNFTDEDTTQGLLMLNDPPAATVDGAALAWATITAPEIPGGPLTVKVKMPIPKTNVPPAPPRPMEIKADGSAVALTFGKPGEAVIRVGNLDLDLSPRSSSGALTQMGRIVTTCTQDPGQDNQLAKIRISENLDTVPPGAPGAPAVTGKSDTTVALSWGAASDDVGIAGYDLYNAATKVSSTYGTGTSATITNLEPDTEYTFTVKARDGSGNVSPAGPPVSVRTATGPDTRPPTVPGKPAATGNTETRVSLSWRGSTDNRGVTGYEVYRNGGLAMRVSGTKATMTDLAPGTGYRFKVKARDAAGNLSGFSEILTASTKRDTKRPTVPGSLRVTGKSPRTVTLAWRASADNVRVAGYNVLVYGRKVKHVTGTRAVVIDLRPGTSYRFKIRAYDRSGNLSGFSRIVTARTGPGGARVAENPYQRFLDMILGGPGDVSEFTLMPER